ncbi:unnamed protein product [Cylindrotheca closterium]|uniref:3'(2'),5'-bisphosphate nucleotidase n=1 Tax=Cylindrotheca closterium TaxID=2856 RepID=A0AAD2CKU6_9STRA|nr:unnamed protein product [Cylindrotheca closterium]
MRTVSLTQLLSTCVDASHQGCKIIRAFQEKGYGEGKLKEEGDARSVLTQADLDAQAKIIGSLRGTWGSELNIIGEEDEGDAAPTFDGNLLNMNLLDETSLQDEELSLDEISLFVDPLDGTREFVEGRLENVASLIGIARHNKTLAGVVGLPFAQAPEADIVIHYGAAHQKGSAGTWPVLKEKDGSIDDNVVTVFTGDSKDEILQKATLHALNLAENTRHVIVGGTASKFQRLLSVPNSVAVLHFKSQLWDTCASESIINSKGGKVTDMFGSPLVHSPQRSFGNIFAVIASSGDKEASELHDKLCAQMRADTKAVHKIFGKWMGSTEPSTPQAVDVIRNLDGIPLSTKEIEDFVLEGRKGSLKGYSAPESGAWRGMMSNGGRLLLEWENNDDGELPSSVFYKRIVMADLEHSRNKLMNAPHKLIRDVKSYQVETSFLTSRACQEGLIKEAGLKINKVFGSDLRPVASTFGPKEQLQSKFSILLDDFNAEDGWEQRWLLDESAAKASIAEFAKMHAYFWDGSNFWKQQGGQLAEELEASVWENGGYMQPSLQGFEQYEIVAKGFEARLPTFEEELKQIPELKDADLVNIGKRLESLVARAGRESHPFKADKATSDEFKRYRTLIHGDPKQANIFFRKSSQGSYQVGLIDFQWTGFGLAATEVAHHFSASLLPSCLSYDGVKEAELLDYYYSSLKKDLVRFGAASSEKDVEERVFPREILQAQYEIALLDICRMVFAYAWRRWKAETEPTAASLNRNAYNKSTESALWLITRCHVLLQELEAKRGI